MQSTARTRRLPKNYQLVYDVVCAQPLGKHAAAGEIHSEARRRQAGIGSSTVYRALDRLRDIGLLHEVRVPGMASALYEQARTGHAHFLCTECGQVEDIPYHISKTDIAGLDLKHDIAIADVALTFNGSCKMCRTRSRRD